MVNINLFLFISVQPRLNDDIPSSDELIRLSIGMSLNLTVNLISNPTPTTQWILRRKGFIDQTLQPHNNSNGYQYTSTIYIYIQTINSTQYGSYIVSATNDIGNFSTAFSVIQPVGICCIYTCIVSSVCLVVINFEVWFWFII
jgi:hypothetical protein